MPKSELTNNSNTMAKRLTCVCEPTAQFADSTSAKSRGSGYQYIQYQSRISSRTSKLLPSKHPCFKNTYHLECRIVSWLSIMDVKDLPPEPSLLHWTAEGGRLIRLSLEHAILPRKSGAIVLNHGECAHKLCPKSLLRRPHGGMGPVGGLVWVPSSMAV